MNENKWEHINRLTRLPLAPNPHPVLEELGNAKGFAYGTYHNDLEEEMLYVEMNIRIDGHGLFRFVIELTHEFLSEMPVIPYIQDRIRKYLEKHQEAYE
jgi:hypothetical protein